MSLKVSPESRVGVGTLVARELGDDPAPRGVPAGADAAAGPGRAGPLTTPVSPNVRDAGLRTDGGAADGAYVPATASGDPLAYVRTLGFEGALLLAVLDRLQGIDQDLQTQVATITARNCLKRLYNTKLGQLTSMLQAAQRAVDDHQETDTLTFTVPKEVATTGAYRAGGEAAGEPTLEELPPDAPQAVALRDNGDGTVTVTASVADLKAAIDRVRSAMDSLTTEGEIAMVRLQFLENSKNSAVTMLTQHLRTSHETTLAVAKNL